jgi:hypothetical protein
MKLRWWERAAALSIRAGPKPRLAYIICKEDGNSADVNPTGLIARHLHLRIVQGSKREQLRCQQLELQIGIFLSSLPFDFYIQRSQIARSF